MAAPTARRALSKLFKRVAIGFVLYVLALNVTVRRHGGDASLFSLNRLREKSLAVVLLATHSVKHLWSDACSDTAGYVSEAARAEGIPVSFALAIARAESGFRSHSISSTGAMGVMQLMPATARRHGVVDPFDPADNARGAAQFIRTLWTRYHGDKLRVAAAYNAGEGGVPRRGPMRVPQQTLSYAATVMKHDRRNTPVECLTSPMVITADHGAF